MEFISSSISSTSSLTLTVLHLIGIVSLPFYSFGSGYGQVIRALWRAPAVVPLEALSAKPVTLAPVRATIKLGFHIYPFLV
jgi:hypothetical protein